MKAFTIGFIALALFISSCAGTQQASSSVSPELNSLLWQQTAAEYEALCYQAFNAAKHSLLKILEEGEFEQSPMVILDLDETVLNNSAYNGKLLLNKKEYSPESWTSWVNKQEAPFIPGAFEFMNFARENGVKIGFISNRDIATLQATIDNMTKNGLEFEARNFMLKNESSSKIKRRQKFGEIGTIVMLIGDNLADFDDVFDNQKLTISERKSAVEINAEAFGYKYIILPNVMYGNWKSALELEDSDAEQNVLPGAERFIKAY